MHCCEEYIYRTNVDSLICSLETWALHIMHVYKGVRSCPTKTYYTLTNGKINLNQLYLSLLCIVSWCYDTYRRVGCDWNDSWLFKMRSHTLSSNAVIPPIFSSVQPIAIYHRLCYRIHDSELVGTSSSYDNQGWIQNMLKQHTGIPKHFRWRRGNHLRRPSLLLKHSSGELVQ